METRINTSGGSATGGDVNTGGGDFTGRDVNPQYIGTQVNITSVAPEILALYHDKLSALTSSFLGNLQDQTVLIKEQRDEILAYRRIINIELGRLERLESIITQASNVRLPSVSDKPVDEDWIYNFRERAQDVSDKQMQEYWARILAGEIAQPGSFSIRALEAVKTLSIDEAKLFATCCRFVWNGEEEEDKFVPIILYDEKRRLCEQAGLTFTTLHLMQSSGLITLGDFSITDPTRTYHIEYFGHHYELTLLERHVTGRLYQFHVGNVLFSQAGRELLRIINAEADRKYEQEILDYWKKDKVTIKKV